MSGSNNGEGKNYESFYSTTQRSTNPNPSSQQQQQHQHHQQQQQHLRAYNNNASHQYSDRYNTNRDYSPNRGHHHPPQHQHQYNPSSGPGTYGENSRALYNHSRSIGATYGTSGNGRNIFEYGPPCCNHLNLHPPSSPSHHLHSIHHPPPQYRDAPPVESPHRNYYNTPENQYYGDPNSDIYHTMSTLTRQHHHHPQQQQHPSSLSAASSSASSRFGLSEVTDSHNLKANPTHSYNPPRVDRFKIKFPGDLGTIQQQQSQINLHISTGEPLYSKPKTPVKMSDKSVMTTMDVAPLQQQWSTDDDCEVSIRALMMMMKSPLRNLPHSGVPDLLPSSCVLRQTDFTTNYDPWERNSSSSPGQRRRNNYDEHGNRRRGGGDESSHLGGTSKFKHDSGERKVSNWRKVRKYVGEKANTFFGLDGGGDELKEEWLSRRKRFASRSYSERYVLDSMPAPSPYRNIPQDQLDSIPTRDQQPAVVTSRGKVRTRKKDHIFIVYWNVIRWIFWVIRFGRAGRRVAAGAGCGSDIVQNARPGSKLSGRVPLDSKMFRDRNKSRSISPNTLAEIPASVTISSHELFFDDVEDNNRNSSHLVHPPGRGLYWRVPNRPSSYALNGGLEAYRISADILNKILDNSARRKYRQRIRQPTSSVKKTSLIDEYNDYRPYFTYFITIVQCVILLTSMISYGIAPIALDLHRKSSLVLVTSLSLQQMEIIQPANFWIGPSAADLIHLGAKFAPCMRRDEAVHRRILEIRDKERQTACCIRNDNSGCVQASRNECSIKGVTRSGLLSTWKKWTGNEDNGRISGSVCGLDPKFCEAPASVSPFEWPDDITKWPICRKTRGLSAVSTKDYAAEHMVCEIIGHPCCIGIHAKCVITTREYCRFVNGYFHEEASLCSQVACLEDVCGMFPFLNYETPDQFYRLFSSLFLHAGLGHLLFTVLFHWFIMRDLEKLAGPLRICVIYFGSGIGGNLASVLLEPHRAEVGPGGAQYGLIACLIVELLHMWKILRRPWQALGKMVIVITVFFILGFLPWVDNFAHIFGFITGFFLSHAVMPYIAFGKYSSYRKYLEVVFCILAFFIVIALLLIIFYAGFGDCEFCKFFNCLPLTSEFCAEQDIDFTWPGGNLVT